MYLHFSRFSYVKNSKIHLFVYSVLLVFIYSRMHVANEYYNKIDKFLRTHRHDSKWDLILDRFRIAGDRLGRDFENKPIMQNRPCARR